LDNAVLAFGSADAGISAVKDAFEALDAVPPSVRLLETWSAKRETDLHNGIQAWLAELTKKCVESLVKLQDYTIRCRVSVPVVNPDSIAAHARQTLASFEVLLALKCEHFPKLELFQKSLLLRHHWASTWTLSAQAL
jgi:hypothetical protein